MILCDADFTYDVQRFDRLRRVVRGQCFQISRTLFSGAVEFKKMCVMWCNSR